MAIRLRVLALVALLLPLSVPALGVTFTACWTETVWDPVTLESQTVTRCRIAGGGIVDYASDSVVPSVLYPQTGTDTTGQCWYYTSIVTQYVILNLYANGDADIGFDTEPANPGGIVAIGPRFPRCTSEPSLAVDPSSVAWQYVMQYVHNPPAPDLSPKPGDGVTGLATFVGVPIPDHHSARLAAGGVALDVDIEVSAVIVDWGDGHTNSYPATSTALAGYPDGIATHVYEVKDPDLPLSVSYDWTAHWRVVGDSWQLLAVPNTTTTVDYPIAEIVSDLTG